MVVMLLALLVLGPEKLPETARKLGKGMRELRRASNMFTDMFMLEEDPKPAKQGAHAGEQASQQPSGSFEPPPYEYKEGDTIARDVQKRLRSRPVLLSKVRYPTHIESVPLTPCRQTPSQDAQCVHVELAPTRGVGL